MMQRIKIGTYTVKEPTTFTRHYETAAWYTKILVQPGTYDAVMTLDPGTRWVLVRLTGKNVGSYLGALWGGMPISPGTGYDEHLGRDEQYTIQTYPYMVAAEVLDQREQSLWTLDLDVVRVSCDLWVNGGKLALGGTLELHTDLTRMQHGFIRGAVAEAKRNGRKFYDEYEERRAFEAEARDKHRPYTHRTCNVPRCYGSVEVHPVTGLTCYKGHVQSPAAEVAV